MLDTNVLISMIFFTGKRFLQMMEYITTEHTLVLSSFVIDELIAVADRKFPTEINKLNKFLSKLNYDLVPTPQKMKLGLFDIRDIKDYPVLYTAYLGNVDILVTGDKDFCDVNIHKPEILTPTEFIDKYIN